jgi:hypothetical protein
LVLPRVWGVKYDLHLCVAGTSRSGNAGVVSTGHKAARTQFRVPAKVIVVLPLLLLLLLACLMSHLQSAGSHTPGMTRRVTNWSLRGRTVYAGVLNFQRCKGRCSHPLFPSFSVGCVTRFLLRRRASTAINQYNSHMVRLRPMLGAGCFLTCRISTV